MVEKPNHTGGSLAGRRALVTGASRGIGRATAILLAESGVDVAVNYRSNDDAAAETCEGIENAGQRAIPVRADVSDADEIESLVETVAADLGPVDVLVNNAGIAQRRSIEDLTREDWDEHLATNLSAAFELTQAVLPAMRDQEWAGSSTSRRWPRGTAG